MYQSKKKSQKSALAEPIKDTEYLYHLHTYTQLKFSLNKTWKIGRDGLMWGSIECFHFVFVFVFFSWVTSWEMGLSGPGLALHLF